MKKYFLHVGMLALFFLHTASAFAQTIRLDFSSHLDADLVLQLKQGTSKETVFSGKLKQLMTLFKLSKGSKAPDLS